MRVEATEAGLFLPDVGLHLDPAQPVPFAAVSHGHGDHARALPGRMWATPETAAIVRARVGETETVVAGYREPVDLRIPGHSPARLTFHSAGHVLGSAGILVERGGERFFYTGDVKLAPSRTCAPADIPRCDALLIESTFGLPVFRFPPVEEAQSLIVAQARDALASGEIPVFLGYALGKGPEIARILLDAGIAVSLHGAVGKMVEIYARFGVPFPGAVPYAAGALEGRALVVPPDCRNHPMITKLKKSRVVAVTGWALLDASYDRYGAQGLVPLSDHADFDDLLRIVELSGARRVRTLHGFAEPLARVLALGGLDAEPLGERKSEAPEPEES